MNKNTVTKEDVARNMKDYVVRTVVEFDKPCTYVTVRMENGFTLRESTTCVDPENYDEEIGKDICLEKIEDKIWFLLGYALQDKLSKQKITTAYERLVAEKEALDEKTEKLFAALNASGFEDRVGEAQYSLMRQQLAHMQAYSSILRLRIAKWQGEK